MEHLLETYNLTKSYNGHRAVDGLNIGVRKGEVVGLLGPNGAGKTTTFYLIVGLLSPDEGNIIFDGADITELPMYRRARRGIGYLSQEPSIFRKMTVGENIMAILETLPLTAEERKRRLDALVGELGIVHLVKRRADTLSGGERRRLEITRALVTEPLFILLDEPFSGIDPIAVQDAKEIIAELKGKNLGVLLTDHNVREALDITDRAYIINEGKILVSGTAPELINDPKAREIYLGEGFKM